MEVLKEEPQELPLRGPLPKSEVRFNRKNVILVVGIVGIVFSAITISGLIGRADNKKETSSNLRPIAPGDFVKNLPSDYSQIKTKLVKPLNGDLGKMQLNNQGDNQLEKYKEQREIERLKKEALARESDVTFNGLRGADFSNKGNVSLVGMNGGSVKAEAVTDGTTDDQNKQDEKINFLNSSRENDYVSKQRLKEPVSKYQVMAGTIIPAVMISGINSDLPGKLLAQVSQNVFDTVSGNYLLIPQGTKIIGEYDSQVAYGQERVLVVWTRLIFPDGKSISLEGMPGVDLSGYAGFKDKVNNHYGKLITGVVLGSMLGASAQVARGSNRNINPDFSQLAVEGAAENVNEAGQQITRKNLSVQPTIEISPGIRVNVFVTRDLVL